MRLVRCDGCGAKAILAASQCPKCAEPLYVRNERGDDVRLVSCRSCQTYYPASRDGCRWCPAVQRGTVPPWTRKAAAAVLAITMGWGGWQLLPASTPLPPAPNVITLQQAPVPRLASVAVFPSFANVSTQRAEILPVTAPDTRTRTSTQPAPRAATGATPTRMAAESSRPTRTAGSTEFVSAKATTWVNVRAEANGRSAIVGIIQPDSIVELGESRGGWRRVDTRWLSGWASAKLFAVDSIRRWGR